jgi:hypothetical protein
LEGDGYSRFLQAHADTPQGREQLTDLPVDHDWVLPGTNVQ